MAGSLFWERRDTPGAEHTTLTKTASGMRATGTALAVDPIPYTARYDLQVDPSWATTSLEVQAEGGGWSRALRMQSDHGRWRITTEEHGDLDAVLTGSGHAGAGFPGTEDPDLLYGAFDVDLTGSPLTNTLPVRRLDLLAAATGVAHRVSVAWVLLPSLEVVPADQIYTSLGDGRVRFANETFSADLTFDDEGFVLDYPGLAQRKA